MHGVIPGGEIKRSAIYSHHKGYFLQTLAGPRSAVHCAVYLIFQFFSQAALL